MLCLKATETRVSSFLELSYKKGGENMSWRELHAMIDKSEADRTNKEADKMLVYQWDQFKRIKGKTFGDIIRKAEHELGVHPSFLALSCKSAEEYIKLKYNG